ncbi:putative serine/threonine protein phosphatase [Physocladia obscura]|uniref:Serine/threonine-protein phosphatase n=1 Tax=Physocladia obscura TaxID=109957 RepID=A0AAD5SZC5_9FUNG|nr:putative serine/threonine protein phosphatase [Physocladia obscura]
MGIDIDLCISQCYQRQLLSEAVVKELCELGKAVLAGEGNVRQVAAPVTVVGDVHGQFYDVLEIFKIAGYCPDVNYVFLGDYVDRGFFSVETIALLLCLKIRHPHRITLIRGNHESRATYGFYTECLRKYGNSNVWMYFTDFFDYLVLGAVIEDAIFCVHGGLSPSIHTLDQIKVIDRFKELPHEGPMADLVWSDPAPAATATTATTPAASLRFTAASSSASDDMRGDFQISPRGAGYLFGKIVTAQFLATNDLGHICRAHQLCMEGYQVLFDDLVSTVWSAPNYCYRAGNLASVLQIGVGLERFFNVFGPCPDDARVAPNRDGGAIVAASTNIGGGGMFDDDEVLASEDIVLEQKKVSRIRGRGGGISRSGVTGGGGGGLVREISSMSSNGVAINGNSTFSNPVVSEFFL